MREKKLEVQIGTGPSNSSSWVKAIAAGTAAALTGTSGFAQTITTTPVPGSAAIAAVPTSGFWTLTLMAALLAALGAWLIRSNHAQRAARSICGVLALALGLVALGYNPSVRAAVASMWSFTQPGGETLNIPILPEGSSQEPSGFTPIQFTNASGARLKISAITDPASISACFPSGVPASLPTTPLPIGATVCAQNLELDQNSSCFVDVASMCTKGVATISASPTTLSFAPNAYDSITVTAHPSSLVSATNVVPTIPQGSSLTVMSNTCGSQLPPGGACTITLTSTSAEGPTNVVIGGANTNAVSAAVTVAPNTYTVGGVVSGLVGSVTLQNNGGDSLTQLSNGSFTFSTPVAQGSPYSVTVAAQPATQTCTVINGSGTMSASNVSNIAVTCSTNTYTVGGVVSGLAGSVTLQNNGSDSLVQSSDGSFTFSTPVAQGSSYLVTVAAQPATQTCTVINGSGTVSASNVSNIAVTCSTNAYTVGGVVSGLAGSVTLQNNGGDSLTQLSNGSFTFSTPVAQGSPYSVTVAAQPATQSCTVINGSGTVTASNVSNIVVTCSTNTYTVGGVVSGLVGSVILLNNGSDTLVQSSGGSFTFSTPVAQGSSYLVTVAAQPATQSCTVMNGSGTVPASNVTNIEVNCS
ncbi:midcut-by-XrtH protein [Ottowia thiooxydans]|uniref:midcut-by-XrtH protein n=1 Tax=Ottowia thiooxydans TaxID=219182 RepID=UPI000686BF9B|nr:midcut-by-XrtH protein [Ottowia thiooxydans]